MTLRSDGGERALLWSQQILKVLVARGLREVQIAPGSRSTPLVLAAASTPGLFCRVHIDERCAAFFALGYGRRSGLPSAVITTSGTAVANLLPAVVEASASDVPLVLMSADRPPGVRGRDANQTIRQLGIFGSFVRRELDLALPSDVGLKGGVPASAAADAWAGALGPPAGPVHLNVAFEKPLEPAVAGAALSPGAPPTPASDVDRPKGVAGFSLTGKWRAELETFLRGAERPLVVAGPSSRPRLDGPAVLNFARRLGAPVLADPLSGARFRAPEGGGVIGAYTHFLQVPEVLDELAPDVVVRTGRTPTSAHLERALEQWSGARQAVVDAGFLRKDHQGLAHLYAETHADALLGAVACAPAPGGWLSRWLRVEEASWQAVEETMGREGHEGGLVAAALGATPEGGCFFVSSSMPVRDLDGYGRPNASLVVALGNRGASGIDGIVSSALGCAAGGDGPLVAVLGDLALIHDLGGLLAARDPHLEAVLVVIDNDGGGIFHMLPIRAFEPVFTPYFATPHGLELRDAAALFGVPFADVDSPEALSVAVSGALAAGGVRMIRVRTDREVNRACHQETTDRVAARVKQILGEEAT